MTILELQEKVRDALNGVEELVQGGCRAFAEDSGTVYSELQQQIQSSSGGVALVVVTPRLSRSGSGVAGGIPVECTIDVQCTEKPELNRRHKGSLTALDAAELVAHCLDGDIFEFASIEQFADVRTGTVTATASFGFSFQLTTTTT